MNWTYTIVSIIACFLSGRMAYGCWAWESSKTWYCTEDEIKYLRDLNEKKEG